MSENKNKSEGTGVSKLNSSDTQNKGNVTTNTFVPALSIYGKVNTVLTNDPEGYHNKESDEVYELLSSSLEIYLRDIVKKMSENRQQRLKRITKVVNGKPANLNSINKVIEKINKEEKKLELQRKRSRKENGIEIDDETVSGNGGADGADSAQAIEQQPKMTAKAAANSQSLESQLNDNNSTANLFTGGMNKKYSWLSGGAAGKSSGKPAAAKPSGGSLGGNPFSGGEAAYVQSDIRNHIIKEEKNLVMRDLIKVLESELNNDNKKISMTDIQEILAKGYARLRD